MNKLRIIICFFSLFFVEIGHSQTDQNLYKYWYYRHRLNYFVIPGLKAGESLMAGIRNKIAYNSIEPYENLSFGQNGVYFGYYLGILATEYRLLKRNGHDADAGLVENEIVLALEQFYTYMDSVENSSWPWLQSRYDGIFVRNSVPSDFLCATTYNGMTLNNLLHIDLLNENLTTDNDYDVDNDLFTGLPRGHPGWVDYGNASILGVSTPPECMSLDEAIGVMMGLALCKFAFLSSEGMVVPSTGKTIKETANDMGRRIFLTLFSNNSWFVALPDGTSFNGAGEFNTWAYGVARVGWYFNCYTSTLNDLVAQSTWNDCILISIGEIFNDVMELTLAAIGNSWENNISSIIYKASPYEIATFYLYLLTATHFDVTLPDEIRTAALGQLSSAPGEGPYNYDDGIHPDLGWSYSYKWRGDVSEQYLGNGDVKGNFSGCDYMLLYNMYFLSENTPLPDYHPYTDLTLNENWPFLLGNNIVSGSINNPAMLLGFHSIQSSSIIHNQTLYDYEQNMLLLPIDTAACVSYVAGSEIKLVPGFIAQHGTNFTAQIQSHILWQQFNNNTADYTSENSDLDNMGKSGGSCQLKNYYSENISRQSDLLYNSGSKCGNAKIFPNPASSNVTIEFECESDNTCDINIYDCQNKLLKTLRNKSNSDKIDVSFLSPGYYICKVRTKTCSYICKLIKI